MTRVLPAAARRLGELDLPAIIIGRDYRVLATNRAYTQRYGTGVRLNKDRCHGVSHGYDTPCDQNGESCPLTECLQRKSRARVTHVHHTPRGPEHCDIHMEPIYGDDGEVAQFVEIIRPIEQVGATPDHDGMMGRSQAFNELVGLIERVAPSEIPVLLLGETGTGKELAARAVHQASDRAHGPFVPVECSGLSSNLIESELFGHEKGAFTGATRERPGLIEAARGGTLFLDEIGDIPYELQVKLLRVLESGSFRRVGGVEVRSSDFRLVSATHADLVAQIDEGSFRRDLYYRISAFPIHLPSLEERSEDIPLLARAFLRDTAPDKTLSRGALRALQTRRYPGNIRELRHVIQRAALLADDDQIEARHISLGPELRRGPTEGPGWVLEPLDAHERRYLIWALEQEPNRAALARKLKISERSLYRRLKALSDDEAAK